MKKGIELLAPVGSKEALKAAVQNGADAVYLGGKPFNARQYAQNFDIQDLQEVVRYAHLHGVRVYITVNTLVSNAEFPELLEYLYSLYSLNVDALLVQDLGVALAARTMLPHLEVHASTQMTIHNGAGVRFLEQLGFARVVLAREVSLKNIEKIGDSSKLPLETFVHGALCVCYSGQCLMSSMIGGRSGNRGRCAQPCRLPYRLVDREGREIMGGHLLSPRDLKMIEHLPLLARAGIVSLKVEGRMKRPEYVATVIRHYRQAIDAYNADPDKYRLPEEAQAELAQIFNRDFTSGYFLEKPGAELMNYQRPNNRGLRIGRIFSYHHGAKEVTVDLEGPLQAGDGYEIWVTRGGRIAGQIHSLKQEGREIHKAMGGRVSFPITEGFPRVGDRVFKTMDVELINRARETFLSVQGIRKFPLSFRFFVRLGLPVKLGAWDNEGNETEIVGDYLAEQAHKHPLDLKTLRKQLERLGNTIYYLDNLELDMDGDLMVPVSVLNNLRREAVERLEELRLARFEHPFVDEKSYHKQAQAWLEGLPAASATAEADAKAKETSPRFSVVVGDLASLEAALAAGARIIYFGGEKLRRKESIGPGEYRDAVLRCHAKGVQAVFALPRLYQEEAVELVRADCELAREAGVDGFLVGNPGTLQLARELGLKGVRGDYTLNIFNDLTIKLLLELGVEQVTLSPELTLAQIEQFRYRGHVPLESLVHGRLALMITEHCAIGNILGSGHREKGCGMPCLKDVYGLKDRMNMVFPLESDENCRMLVYNPKTLSLLERLPQLLKTGIEIFRIDGKREDAAWIRQVVGIYREELERCLEGGDSYQVRDNNLEILDKLAPDGYTTGHYYRGVL